MADVDFTLVTNRLIGTPPSEKLDNATLVRFNPPDWKVSGLGNPPPSLVREPSNAVFDVIRSVRKRRWLRRHDFDGLHVHSVYDVDTLFHLSTKLRSELFYDIALSLNDFRWAKRRAVFTEHGLIGTGMTWGPLAARMASDLAGYHDNIICVEQKGYDILKERFKGKGEKRVWLIPNGVVLDEFKPATRPSDGPLRVGYAARLDKHGLALLVAVAELLPPTVELVIAGAGYSKSTLPESVTSKRNVVLNHGIPHDKMPEFYRGIDILLELHDHEIFGLTVLEGMACGRPVIRTKGLYRYPVVDGVTGFLVDATPPSIVDRISELSKDPATLGNLGRNARLLVEKEFDARQMVAKIREVYEEVGTR